MSTHSSPPPRTTPCQQRLGRGAARPRGASPAPGHADLVPFPSTEPSPQPRIPLPREAVSSADTCGQAGPQGPAPAQLQLRRSDRCAKARGTGNSGNHATVVWEPHRWAPPRPPGPGEQPGLSAFPARSVRVTKEHGEGQDPRAPHPRQQPHGGSHCPPVPRGEPGTPQADRAPFPPPDEPHVCPLPALRKQFGAGVEGGHCPVEAKLPLQGQPEGSAGRSGTPGAGRAGGRLSHSPNHPGAGLKTSAPFSMTSSGARLANCMRASVLGEDAEGPAKRGNEGVNKSHRRSTRQEPGTE